MQLLCDAPAIQTGQTRLTSSFFSPITDDVIVAYGNINIRNVVKVVGDTTTEMPPFAAAVILNNFWGYKKEKNDDKEERQRDVLHSQHMHNV